MRALKLIVVMAVAAAAITACWADQVMLPPTPATGPAPTSTPRLVTPSPTFHFETLTPLAPATVTVTPTSAATFPDAAAFQWVHVTSGLDRVVDLQNADDGSGRVFVVEKLGHIHVINASGLVAEPYLTIVDRVGSSSNEQGLLGLAFHPDFKTNGYLYVNYTDLNGDTVIARFTATAPDEAEPASEKILLRVDQPYPNHNGGALAFGPDGYLYIGLGDGGLQGDPAGNAQSGNSLLGKILRIDVNNGDPYAIPADNPFAGSGEVYQEIWALGLRNPWRFAFDRATGALFIGDVGQNQYEEIDLAPRGLGGLNFGWDYREGLHQFESEAPAGAALTDPVYEYAHGPGCSVTGGVIYRGAALPEWQGIYLFADYCSGEIWGLIQTQSGWQAQRLFDTNTNIASFGVDEAGEVYFVNDSGGAVFRLTRK